MDDTTIATPIANTATTSAVLETEANTDVLREALLEDELLVEEISIDGMCGVY
jgi:mycofactocin precursor